MEFNLEWLKSHPYLSGTIVVVGGTVVFLMMKKSGSTASTNDGSGYGYDMNTALQFANINAAQSAQEAQIQGQIQVASLQAGVANNQTQAQLEAYKKSTEAQVELAQIAADVENKKYDSQTTILSTLLTTARDEQLSLNELAKYQLTRKYDLAQSGVELAKRENRGKEGTNVVSIALNQGDINSYNSATASMDIAHSLSTASIINGLTNTAGGILTGLFA